MAHDRWSYQVIDVKARFLGPNSADIQAELNRQGQHGWELVHLQHIGTTVRLVLKRPQ
jgi:hypothetical protein